MDAMAGEAIYIVCDRALAELAGEIQRGGLVSPTEGLRGILDRDMGEHIDEPLLGDEAIEGTLAVLFARASTLLYQAA